MDPKVVISAHPWQRAVFTTYALSLSFFEAVILDSLVRGGTSQALILADVDGVRASLAEQGAQRVGKDYEVEPVAVHHDGVFHPKLTVLISGEHRHLLVGSGNLTFGGWGGNCEVIEHLHAGFAPAAVEDAAHFFELLAESTRLQLTARAQCLAVAADLRRGGLDVAVNPDVRLLHNLELPLEDQIVELANGLGGAERIAVAAAYWDEGVAIDSLCKRLNLSEALLHAHPTGVVFGNGKNNWPRDARTTIRPVMVNHLSSDTRRLHAKAFEIKCRRGRLVITGSANGSRAALTSRLNVELCVVRIQRGPTNQWAIAPAEAPAAGSDSTESEETADRTIGVLRAELEADVLSGTVLTPVLAGSCRVSQLTGTGPVFLGVTSVSKGAFALSVPGLEQQSWRGGRLVIRVETEDGRQAEGYVSVASYADVSRRLGLIGRRFADSIMAGTETPADVATMMAWLQENPDRLLTGRDVTAGGPMVAGRHDEDSLVSVASLRGTAAPVVTHASDSEARLTRFVDQFIAALREPRGSIRNDSGASSSEDGGSDDSSEGVDSSSEREIEETMALRAFQSFEKVLSALTTQGVSARNVLLALDLASYVCDRLRPEADRARRWLDQVMACVVHIAVPPERRDTVIAAILTKLGHSPTPSAFRSARAQLLAIGADLGVDEPTVDMSSGLLTVLPTQVSLSDLWTRLRVTRTYAEQIVAYTRALESGTASSEYPDLPSVAPSEWPTLERAITDTAKRSRIAIVPGSTTACPRCDVALSPAEASRMQHVGITTATRCCGLILLGSALVHADD